MAFDLKNPYAQAYINVGRKFGASPAFISASLGNSWDESRWDSANRSGDHGAAYGGMQWNSKYSPDRVQGLMRTAKELNKPWTDPEVQATWWYKENQGNLGVNDINQANDAVVNSLRPAGWKQGNPTGVPTYNSRKNNSLELFNMLSKGQDPRSFMALGSDSMPAANTEQPQGAQNAGTGVPQSISLGNEEQQPFSNIGSTLANMGASIASLDNRGTGIASLNASRVASNLQQQEALRERENGWKYAGQTQNGQGLIFQNSKGEMRVEPLSGQFAGQKESSTTQMLRDMQAHPELLKTYQDLHNTGQQSNYDEDGNWKYETSKEDVATLIKRAAAGEGNDVLKGQTKKTRADFNHLVTEMGIAPETFAAGKANQSGLLQQSREFGRRQGVLEIAVPKLQADITVARDLLQQYKKENPNGSWKGWNWLKNAGTEEFTGPGAQTLAKLKETFKTLTDQFGTVQQNGQLTEASRQQAAKLINENMDTGVAEAVLDNMQSLGVRSLNSVRQAHENHMARIMKQPIPYPELEVDPETNGGSKKSTIRNTEPSSGIDKNAAMEELRRRGLIK